MRQIPRSGRLLALLSVFAILLIAGVTLPERAANAVQLSTQHSLTNQADSHGGDHRSGEHHHCQSVHVPGCGSSGIAIVRHAVSDAPRIGCGHVGCVRNDMSRGLNPSPPKQPPRTF